MIGPRMPYGSRIRHTRPEAEAIAAAASESDRASWLAQLLTKTISRGECRIYGGEFLKKPSADRYGWTRFYGATLQTHRLSLILHSGSEVGVLVVRHGCDTPGCINPEHLEVGTHQDNNWDALRRGRVRGVPPDRLPEVIARRVSGETLRSIGLAFGVSHQAIRLLVKRHGRAA